MKELSFSTSDRYSDQVNAALKQATTEKDSVYPLKMHFWKSGYVVLLRVKSSDKDRVLHLKRESFPISIQPRGSVRRFRIAWLEDITWEGTTNGFTKNRGKDVCEKVFQKFVRIRSIAYHDDGFSWSSNNFSDWSINSVVRVDRFWCCRRNSSMFMGCSRVINVRTKWFIFIVCQMLSGVWFA